MGLQNGSSLVVSSSILRVYIFLSHQQKMRNNWRTLHFLPPPTKNWRGTWICITNIINYQLCWDDSAEWISSMVFEGTNVINTVRAFLAVLRRWTKFRWFLIPCWNHFFTWKGSWDPCGQSWVHCMVARSTNAASIWWSTAIVSSSLSIPSTARGSMLRPTPTPGCWRDACCITFRPVKATTPRMPGVAGTTTPGDGWGSFSLVKFQSTQDDLDMERKS